MILYENEFDISFLLIYSLTNEILIGGSGYGGQAVHKDSGHYNSLNWFRDIMYYVSTREFW